MTTLAATDNAISHGRLTRALIYAALILLRHTICCRST